MVARVRIEGNGRSTSNSSLALSSLSINPFTSGCVSRVGVDCSGDWDASLDSIAEHRPPPACPGPAEKLAAIEGHEDCSFGGAATVEFALFSCRLEFCNCNCNSYCPLDCPFAAPNTVVYEVHVDWLVSRAALRWRECERALALHATTVGAEPDICDESVVLSMFDVDGIRGIRDCFGRPARHT